MFVAGVDGCRADRRLGPGTVWDPDEIDFLHPKALLNGAEFLSSPII
jgi:hypothetical protein